MKLLKNSLLLVAVAFMLDGILVFAATQKTYVSFNIAPGATEKTSYKTKASDSYGAQTYKNTFTNTTLTSPCPNCVIAVKFESRSGDYTEQTVTMNNTITCNNTALWQPGDYRLKLRRSDITALSTYTSGEWTY